MSKIMSKYINAIQGNEVNSIQYDIDAKTADVRVGGNTAWRHNNIALMPNNIMAKQNGSIGSVAGIAVFPDKSSSQNAFKAEVQRPKHQSKTVGEMINLFIADYIVEPPQWDAENNKPILPWIEQQSGLDMQSYVSSINVDDFISLVESHIGWQAGTEKQIVKDPDAPNPTVAKVSGNNVLINGRTAVHKDSGGVLSTVDVCLTQIGNSVVPIPYPNVAMSSDADATASSVLINGNPACHVKSNFKKSTGDQPGNKKGVASGTIKEKAEFLMGSFNVLIEGNPAVRQGDLMVSNNKNTPPSGLVQPPGPPPQGLSISPRDEKTHESDQASAYYTHDNTATGFKLEQQRYVLRTGATAKKVPFHKGSEE
ncbi:DUF4150 domain-containing protein [Flocculibacter collagenilyticus]|uniref:DUF4150 domain-containing protein n=1 Tax=Flocculibacter collagenilyticus TaxID=2744479 RepID=UPI001F36F31D|nr:DUF4150 domain-containing protein [Flocculibacter collagenilyticus]